MTLENYDIIQKIVTKLKAIPAKLKNMRDEITTLDNYRHIISTVDVSVEFGNIATGANGGATLDLEPPEGTDYELLIPKYTTQDAGRTFVRALYVTQETNGTHVLHAYATNDGTVQATNVVAHIQVIWMKIGV